MESLIAKLENEINLLKEQKKYYKSEYDSLVILIRKKNKEISILKRKITELEKKHDINV